ncbi:methionine--tRNA ligase [Oribacterium sp. oral taxon 078 str. F0263]|uniref:methionine--tRNA ligase n=1 Tax=Oribacterium sp. oral taxon 078 TaxID=652706 RepID=UPI0003AE3B73|nr:methionine--tRNA ligase [Oribacterium sp. oral taxon 078]ERL22212.1 methionine--tRNA ligase [Oribacterium sp. oral taxon 078 str. F0263]
MEKKAYYITTAIAYASGKPHIGNTYEIVLADAIARFKRFEGYDVFFQTGTDEHGQKIEQKAREAGMEPGQYVDGVVGEIRAIWDLMNTSYDKFMRTTDPYHEKQVQKIFRKMYEKGDIYKGVYEGWYCTPCESFWTDSQLVDGKCPDCGRPVERASESSYFFRMSKYADRLMKHIEEHPEFIQPVSRKNEMVNNFLKPGLQDLSVSRTVFKWGIPVDFDPENVIYVWLDALTNYITGLGYDVDGNSSERFHRYWPADLHLIGKDIIRFHTLYWPIFLMSLELPLPKQVFGHPWLLTAAGKSEEGVKMSKSRGNVIYADELVQLFGVDAVRFFVIHEMPFENDGVISWELMAERYNGMLANILGNLVKRSIAMSNKYFGGIVRDSGAAEPVDEDLKETVLKNVRAIVAKMDELRIADALDLLFDIFRRSNKYIDETEPWLLAKEEGKSARLETVLYNLTEAIVIGASVLESFMPRTAEEILRQLNTEARPLEQMDRFGLYPSGTRVTGDPKALFERKDLKQLLSEVEKLSKESGAFGGEKEKSGAGEGETPESTSEGESPILAEKKAEIGYEDFEKLQFRVGKILSAEEVKKSKKLLRFEVLVGEEKLQILSGIKSFYRPEELVGKKVMVLCNLKPRMIAGYESQGMILSAEGHGGELALMTPMRDMPSGAGIC